MRSSRLIQARTCSARMSIIRIGPNTGRMCAFSLTLPDINVVALTCKITMRLAQPKDGHEGFVDAPLLLGAHPTH